MKRTVVSIVTAWLVLCVFWGYALQTANSQSNATSQPQGSEISREQQAAELLATIKAKLRNHKPDYTEVLSQTLQLISNYYETRAAVKALATKGEVLINLKRHDEAYAAYTQLQGQAKSDASLVKAAKRGRSYAILKRGQSLLETLGGPGNNSPAALNKVRADCRRVIGMSEDAKHVARAKIILAEVAFFAGDRAKAEAIAEEALADDFADPAKLHRFAEQILALNAVIAEAALWQNNTQKALQVNDHIKSLGSQLTQEERERLNVRRELDDAYYQAIRIVAMAKAGPAAIIAKAQEALNRAPQHRYATYARDVIAVVATMPSP